jgi:hypothetical protein
LSVTVESWAKQVIAPLNAMIASNNFFILISFRK